nr:MAG TPA: hypothetical protein [Bacteriophage sp.]
MFSNFPFDSSIILLHFYILTIIFFVLIINILLFKILYLILS